MIGEHIKAWRKAIGLSQRELASGELTRSYISMIESGKKTPSASALCLIATRLGISVEELQRGVQYVAHPSSTFFLLSAAQSAYASGDYDSAQVLSHRAMDSTSDESLLARAEHLHLASLLHLNVARSEVSDESSSIETFEALDPDSPFVIPVLLNLGALHFRWEDYRTSRRCYEVVTRRTRGKKHYLNEYAHAKMYLGTVYYRLGDYACAVSCFKEAHENFHTLGDRVQRAHAALGLSGVLSDCGQLDEALQWAEASEALFAHEGNADTVLARHNRAIILLAMSKLNEVPTLLGECIQQYAAQGRTEKLASAYEDLTHFYLRIGDVHSAREHCRAALDLLMHSENAWLLARVYRRFGEIGQAAGELPSALEHVHVSALLLRELRMNGEHELSRELERRIRMAMTPAHTQPTDPWDHKNSDT
ncbi:MAG: helix-turn-helix transcriptional regulator [Firmicutes bacterium]|nr:helix-turn-helix transcriptional regulator [Bacillota bacterium]